MLWVLIGIVSVRRFQQAPQQILLKEIGKIYPLLVDKKGLIWSYGFALI